MKYLAILFMGISAVLMVAVYILFQRQSAPVIEPEPSPSPIAQVTATPLLTASPSATASGDGVATGTVSGKLCYPSQFLPEGTIEAKSLVDQTVVSEVYPGSQNGGKNTYTLAVPQGIYILRYKVSDTLSGYHTDVCPTGLETTCAQVNPRKLLQVPVAAGETVTGIDLCDFYYAPGNAPEF